MSRKLARALRFMAVIAAWPVVTAAQAPEIIYYNAAIITMAPGRPGAQALAIHGDRFAAVGGNSEVLSNSGPQDQPGRQVYRARHCGVARSPYHGRFE